MKIIASFCAALLFVTVNTPTKNTNTDTKLFVSHYENILGTSLEMKFSAVKERDADVAEQAALGEINRLSKIFSSYDPDSEFSRWMKTELNKPVKVSPALFEMLSLFERWKNRSGGALNASAAVAINLWKTAESHNQLPKSSDILRAVTEMNQKQYALNAANSTATRLTNVPLILNTFAKSYIINKACNIAMNMPNTNAAVVNIGGDLVVKGDTNDLINVTDPLASAENDRPITQLIVKNKAVATSGDYRRGEKVKGKWYSHIVDPRTARPVEGIISATVVADDATDAGALATAFNVLSIAESKKLATTVKGAEFLIITKKGEKIESAGWKDYVNVDFKLNNSDTERKLNDAEKPWDPKFELAISFVFNKIEGNGHRPFAAVWIEDANRAPVRNLALWYNKTKWIPDLKNWYRINGDKFKENKENFASATGATRNPGSYTLKWDGKDDSGKYVAQGKYTIVFETAKEHGTNEIIRQQMEFKKSPKKATSAGNVEVANVNFNFYKK